MHFSSFSWNFETRRNNRKCRNESFFFYLASLKQLFYVSWIVASAKKLLAKKRTEIFMHCFLWDWCRISLFSLLKRKEIALQKKKKHELFTVYKDQLTQYFFWFFFLLFFGCCCCRFHFIIEDNLKYARRHIICMNKQIQTNYK